MSYRAHTISVAAVYRLSTRLVHLLSIAGLLLICSVNALAKNSCNTNGSFVNHRTYADSGIGGTGIYNGGVGGTGTQEESISAARNIINDSGIGGTGIVGTITGFESICVNHVEIHYDSNTPISVNGRLSAIEDLAVGQVIAVQARDSDGVLIAHNIAVTHAIVGPISDLNPEIRKMRILSQTIKIEQLPDSDSFSNLKVNHWVQVSGHRLADGTIVASHIESIPPAAEVIINGYVNHVDTSGFEVNGTRIDYDVKSLSADLESGTEVRVEGHWDGAYLKAQYIEIEPTRQSLGKVEHLIIEGYIQALSDNELNINNWTVTLTPNVQIAAGNARSDLRLNQRIQIRARLDADQRVLAEYIKIIKYESPAQLQESNNSNQVDGSDKSNNDNSENNPEIKTVQKNENNLKKDVEHNADEPHSSEIPIEILILAAIIIAALVLILVLFTQSCINRKQV